MTRTRTTRREALRLAGVAAAGGAGLSGTATAQSDDPLASWFAKTSNYEGVVDATGRDEVTVEVGVEANGGAFGFGPAAIRVDPGTTVTWTWTGKGGGHNVVAKAGADFASETSREAGHTFSRTVEAEGVIKYVCAPHKGLGMKGAVVVGDAASAAPSVEPAGSGVLGTGLSPADLGTLGLASALGVGLVGLVGRTVLDGRDRGRRS